MDRKRWMDGRIEGEKGTERVGWKGEKRQMDGEREREEKKEEEG